MHKASSKPMPGPWSVWLDEKRKRPCLVITAPDTEGETGDTLPWCVAEIVSHCGHDEDTAEANAHLIAAAPDLLAACKDALLDFESDDYGGLCKSTVEAMRAAVLKAKGGAE